MKFTFLRRTFFYEFRAQNIGDGTTDRPTIGEAQTLHRDVTVTSLCALLRQMKPAQWILIAAILLFSATTAIAGPPFQTDDPDPIDYHNYEIYTFGSVDATGVEAGTIGPAFELNYGPLPNFHAHIIIPAGAAFPSNNPAYLPSGTGHRAFGLTDVETGLKYRFVQESKTRPMIGVYPMLELPTGNAAKGLGVGKGWGHLPIWAQKSFGAWTTYGGVGETINTAPGYRNFTYGGWELQRQLDKKLWLGGEVFSHASEGAATAQLHSATMIDFGGGYEFRNPGFQFLFAYGHSVYGPAEHYAYIGLYWTWGPENKTATNTAQKLLSSALHF